MFLSPSQNIFKMSMAEGREDAPALEHYQALLSELGRPWASHRAGIFSPAGGRTGIFQLCSSWLDFLRPSEGCWGFPNSKFLLSEAPWGA